MKFAQFTYNFRLLHIGSLRTLSMISAFGFLTWGLQRRDEDANFYDFRHNGFAMFMDMNVLCSTDCEVRCNEIDALTVLTKGKTPSLMLHSPLVSNATKWTMLRTEKDTFGVTGLCYECTK